MEENKMSLMRLQKKDLKHANAFCFLSSLTGTALILLELFLPTT